MRAPFRSTKSTAQGSSKPASRKEIGAAAIREAAKHIFVKYGYVETNLGVVAKKLGITRQAIYHYFPAKHHILIDILTIYFDRLEEIIANRGEMRSDENCFDEMMRMYFVFITEHRAEAMLMAREFAHLPRSEQRWIKARRRKIHDAYVAEYEAGQKVGLFKPGAARLHVALLLGAANWTTRWFDPEGTLGSDELAEAALQLFSQGYRIEAGDAAAAARPARRKPHRLALASDSAE